MFHRPSTHYGTSPAPETPYQKAGQVWDERIGSARVQARNWRLMAIGLLIALVMSTTALVWRSLQSAVTPYVVEVGSDGAVRAVAPATGAYDPSDAQIAHHLATFIQNVRALSVDPVVVRQNWMKAYDMVTDRAAATLNAYARENDPFADIGRRSRSVDVVSVVRMTETSFQARWLEKTYENGALTGARRFTGHFTLVQDTPRDAATLRANPLGLYIQFAQLGRRPRHRRQTG
jgi:type IV secretion system protein TrbF